MTPELLPAESITRELATLPGWSRAGTEIARYFVRADFDASIAFVNAIAAAANAANHHPELAISWNVVTVRLSTHDAGGITERDFALARTIDELARTSTNS